MPPPGKREPLGYTGPEAKGVGRPSPGQRIARSVHRINFIAISEKKWGGLADTTRRKPAAGMPVSLSL